METAKHKLLSPSSSMLRRRFGDTIRYLFEPCKLSYSDFCEKPRIHCSSLIGAPKPDTPNFRPSSIITEGLPVIADQNEPNISPQEIRRKHSRQESWLTARDPSTIRSARRFWSSMDFSKPVLKENKTAYIDIWSSYTTPKEKANEVKNTFKTSFNENFVAKSLDFYNYTRPEPVQLWQCVQNFARPECEECIPNISFAGSNMIPEDSAKRKIFKALRILRYPDGH